LLSGARHGASATAPSDPSGLFSPLSLTRHGTFVHPLSRFWVKLPMLGLAGLFFVPIRPLLEAEAGAFGPDDVRALASAFEASLRELGLVDRSDPAVLLVAKRVIALAKEGSRDPIVLRDRVVKSFKNGSASSP
jgi:hypothetical protein